MTLEEFISKYLPGLDAAALIKSANAANENRRKACMRQLERYESEKRAAKEAEKLADKKRKAR